MKICVLIRVYDRIEDLRYNLEIIKNTWKKYTYDLVVVSNGKDKGYNVTEDIYRKADKVVVLEKNVGHLKGNSQLLLEGMNSIDVTVYDYLIILEADTWLYSDKLIEKYVGKLSVSSAVWASARWYDRFYSLATDFAIIKSSFLEKHTEIFDFETYPECKVCNYLIHLGYSYILIKENMNVQLPSYLKRMPFAPKGRFYAYPISQMVTHHIEDIRGGIGAKKKCFNIVACCNYFNEMNLPCVYIYMANLYMRLIHLCDKCLLRRSWYSKRKLLSV